MADPRSAEQRVSLVALALSGSGLAMATLGFASGLPFTLVTKATSAILADQGTDKTTIGDVGGAIGLVYAYKFLWSPLVDARPAPLVGGLGRRRSWLVASEMPLILAVALLGFAVPHSGEPSAVFLALLVLVAICSATQDIVVNGWTVDAFPGRKLGIGSALSVAGYRVALLVAGWLVLLLGKSWGWSVAFGAMAVLCAAGLVATLASREPSGPVGEATSYWRSIALPLIDGARSLGRWLVPCIAFALVFKLPDQLGNAMQESLLITTMKYDIAQFGLARNAIGLPTTILGSLLGAVAVARMGMMPALLLACVLQALSNLGFAWLHEVVAPLNGSAQPWLSQPTIALTTVGAIESLCGGLTGTVFVAWLMSLCSQRFGASQYALLSGIVQLSASIASALSGRLAHEWTSYYVWSAVAGIPGLALLAIIARRGAATSNSPNSPA